MNESLVLKAALIVAVVGIITLVIIIKISGISEVNIGEAKDLNEGATVIISGIVEKVSSKPGFSIISIKKEESIDVVLFDSINLSKGQKVEIMGKTKDYNGQKELVADRIRVK